MIAGSDRRHGDKKLGLKARSDTIILARIDPGKGVALLSLPRDLKVEIPGHGTDKLNVAYTLGGPKLAIKTVKNAHRASRSTTTSTSASTDSRRA